MFHRSLIVKSSFPLKNPIFSRGIGTGHGHCPLFSAVPISASLAMNTNSTKPIAQKLNILVSSQPCLPAYYSRPFSTKNLDPFKDTESDKDQKSVKPLSRQEKELLLSKLTFLKKKFNPPPRKLRISGMAVYLGETLKGESMDPSSKHLRFKQAVHAWKELSEQEKEKYHRKAQSKILESEKSIESFKQTHEDIAVFNEIKSVCRELNTKEPAFENLIRPKQLSGYTYFISEFMNKEKNSNEAVTELIKRASQAWNKKSDAEKKDFEKSYESELSKNRMEKENYALKLSEAKKNLKEELKKAMKDRATAKVQAKKRGQKANATKNGKKKSEAGAKKKSIAATRRQPGDREMNGLFSRKD